MPILLSILFYGAVIWWIISVIRKKKRIHDSILPEVRHQAKKYDTFNKKSVFRESGSMPHKHETKKYTSSMADASKLPPGYILLNGEPVRVADLEGK